MSSDSVIIYDKTGNLVEDVSENMFIQWTYYNKVKQIDSIKLTPPKAGLVWAIKMKMKYDAMGNRVVKENPQHNTKEIYVRDAQGNIIALYEIKKDSLYLTELYMYGSQRLGYMKENTLMGKLCKNKFCATINTPFPFNPNNSTAKFFNPVPLPAIPAFGSVSTYTPIYYGNKRYELNDWLGNVRVVINDRKTPVNTGTLTLSYKPQVVSVSDYYAFGSQISERSYDPVKPLYRFGFNGKQYDYEIYGKGNAYDFGSRMFDARLGRWWSVDPLAKKYPFNSPFIYADNNPIWKVDNGGDSTRYYSESGDLLLFTTDKLPNSVVIIKDKDISKFLIWKSVGEKYGVLASNLYNTFLRKIGLTYNIELFKKFNDQYKDVRFIDPQTKKETNYNVEHGAFLFERNGQVEIGDYVLNQNNAGNDPETTNWGQMERNEQTKSNRKGRIHTHVNEGRPAYFNPLGTYEYEPSEPDFYNAKSQINVIVSEYNIYFYGGNLKGTIVINPKNFGDNSNKPTQKTYTPKESDSNKSRSRID